MRTWVQGYGKLRQKLTRIRVDITLGQHDDNLTVAPEELKTHDTG